MRLVNILFKEASLRFTAIIIIIIIIGQKGQKLAPYERIIFLSVYYKPHKLKAHKYPPPTTSLIQTKAGFTVRQAGL